MGRIARIFLLRRVYVVALLISLVVIALLAFRATAFVDARRCFDMGIPAGALSDDASLTQLKVTPTLIPPGVECSYTAGQNLLRIATNTGLATAPIVYGFSVIAVGSLAAVFGITTRRKGDIRNSTPPMFHRR